MPKVKMNRTGFMVISIVGRVRLLFHAGREGEACARRVHQVHNHGKSEKGLKAVQFLLEPRGRHDYAGVDAT